MSYDTNNRLASFRDTQEANVWQTIFHDVRGNMIDNGFWAYGGVDLGYDWANQPTSMVGSGLSNTYRYDGNLKRVRTIQNGKTVYWIYSALTGTPLYQDEVTDNVQTHYLSGGGASVRIRNGVAQYTHSDHLGSPVAASAANASTLWREHYTPFGEKTLDPAGNRNDVGYTGHVQDDASGLTYMQARFYDPVIGRFLSTDPIGYQDQLNLYAYVRNDPVNMMDPTGMQGCGTCFPSASQQRQIDTDRASRERRQPKLAAQDRRINAAQTKGAIIALGPYVAVQAAIACGVGCGAAVAGGELAAGAELADQIGNGENLDLVAVGLEGGEGALTGYATSKNLVAGMLTAGAAGGTNQAIDNARTGAPIGQDVVQNSTLSAIGAGLGGMLPAGNSLLNDDIVKGTLSVSGAITSQAIPEVLEERVK